MWTGCADKVFSVHSCYKLLMYRMEIIELDSKMKDSLELIWESKVLSKIKVFSWRFILDRLATRVQLIKRLIILNNAGNWCTFVQVLMKVWFTCFSIANFLFLYGNRFYYGWLLLGVYGEWGMTVYSIIGNVLLVNWFSMLS